LRILLDECVHAGVREAFPGHAVQTVAEIGWRSSPDKALLAHAQNHFDVFVTIDRRLEREQNLRSLPLGFVVVRVPDNTLNSFKPLFEKLRIAVETVKGGEVIHL
jgi:predicted nuclease of predicted toxin-antitoxin system